MRIPLFGLLLFAAFAPRAAAQPPSEPELLASIVAVVGDSVITNFDMREAIASWEATTRQQLPADPMQQEAVLRDLLDSRIDQLLLVQAALRDTTIQVDDAQIDAAVERRLNQLRTQYNGQAGLERALRESNLTLQAFRRTITAQQRRDALVRQFLARTNQIRKPPPVSDAEVRQFFDQNRAQIGERPASITFMQVAVPVEPSDSAVEAARAFADSLLLRARGGEDFDALAKQYSQDPGSKELGGDLGWFRPGDLYPEFERAAYTLRPGAISPPIRTRAGWHIIKLERIRGPERQARHILIRPEIAPSAAERARTLADSLGQELRAGADADVLARRFGDDEEPVRIGPIPRDSLPVPYRAAMTQARQGEVVGPLSVDADGPFPKWAVARVVDVEEAREATVDDYRIAIQQRIAEDKLVAEILEELRRRTHIEIREASLAGTG